jgi:uncharacterized protein involved in response to NO
VKTPVLLDIGFRIFFLLAGIYGVIAMSLWALDFYPIGEAPTLSMAWHAHEMIYGYAVAVIAGFLLTAVRNWTGQRTVDGFWLGVLAVLWVAARIANYVNAIPVAVVFDMTFLLGLCWAAMAPIVRVRQWRQLPIGVILFVLMVANGAYYAGQLGWSGVGTNLGNYLGFYVVIGLILIMTGRVMPMFTGNGVDEDVNLSNHPLLEQANAACYMLFLLLVIAGMFLALPRMLFPAIAGVLALLNLMRMYRWFTPGIFQKPLVWTLHLSYLFLVLGFVLKAIEPLVVINPYVGLHALGAGGIGLITISMMMRVSLGHTGRNVRAPPAAVAWVGILMLVMLLVRVLLPVVFPEDYLSWIRISQGAWIMAFLVFCLVWIPMLVTPRIDQSS